MIFMDNNMKFSSIIMSYLLNELKFLFLPHRPFFPSIYKKRPLEKGNHESEISKFRLKQLRRMEWDPVSIYTTQNTPFENEDQWLNFFTKMGV